MPDDRQPSKPRFGAAQPSLSETPGGHPRPGHPIRALIEDASYPASREDLIRAAAHRREVTIEQFEWLAATLPGGRYGEPDDVLRAMGSSGLDAPASVREL